MAYLTWLITIPLTVFTVLFAVSNGGDITLALWPLDDKATMPVYAFGLAMLGGGFFLGALFVWILSQRTRFLYWRTQRHNARLEKELDGMQAKASATAPDAAHATGLPALPAK